MYPEAKQDPGALVRSKDLPEIHSDLLDVNEKTNAIIQDLRRAIERIKPIQESPSKNTPSNNISTPLEDSFTSGMRLHLAFARRNAEELERLLSHLNSLV